MIENEKRLLKTRSIIGSFTSQVLRTRNHSKVTNSNVQLILFAGLFENQVDKQPIHIKTIMLVFLRAFLTHLQTIVSIIEL